MSIVSADKIKIGGHKIIYDQIIYGDSNYDGINDRTSYYLNDELVFTAYDTNEDGFPDMWFTYTNGTYVDTAMRDQTGDNKPENIVTYNQDGKVINEKKVLNLPWNIIIPIILVILSILIYLESRKEKSKTKKIINKINGQVKTKKPILKKKGKIISDKTTELTNKTHKKTKELAKKAGKQVKKLAKKTKIKTKEHYHQIKNITKNKYKQLKEKHSKTKLSGKETDLKNNKN